MSGNERAKLVGDLQQQRTGKSVFEIGRDEAVDMGEVVPDRALQQEPPQCVKRLRREQIVDGDRPLLLELRGQRRRASARSLTAPPATSGAARRWIGVL